MKTARTNCKPYNKKNQSTTGFLQVNYT